MSKETSVQLEFQEAFNIEKRALIDFVKTPTPPQLNST